MLGTRLPSGHLFIAVNPSGGVVTVTRDARQVHVYVDGVMVGESPVVMARTKPARLCSVCKNRHFAKGFCNTHYKLMREAATIASDQGGLIRPGGSQAVQGAR